MCVVFSFLHLENGFCDADVIQTASFPSLFCQLPFLPFSIYFAKPPFIPNIEINFSIIFHKKKRNNLGNLVCFW